MKSVCALISVLCILLNSGVCRAQVNGNNRSFCLAAAPGAFINRDCSGSAEGSSAYEELKSRFWGGLVQQVWKNSRKRHEKSSLQDNEESRGSQKEDAWKKMVRDADYDLRVSSNHFVMSMKVRF